MVRIEEIILKGLRKIYLTTIGKLEKNVKSVVTVPDDASDIIYSVLSSNQPCMIARFGSTELNAIVNYMAVADSRHSVIDFITGRQYQWWWNDLGIEQMETHSGFFPSNKETISKFSEMMFQEVAECDVLLSWQRNEQLLYPRMKPNLILTELLASEPWWGKRPWSRVLKGKHVLVVHPFSELIESQYYNHREELFPGTDVLPEFASLRTVKAVQSLGGSNGQGFHDWFDALEWMKKEMDKQDYDIALIGCGAYGFPLAAYAKRCGHQAFHMGGVLQLLFGIKGKRWEYPNYGEKELHEGGKYLKMFNDKWVYPSVSDRPANASNVEGACYW
uniref:Uncharacterized protein n=2 Tax=unclassified Prevotella TaxID=2638335 RepID=A0AB33J9D6_9BACT